MYNRFVVGDWNWVKVLHSGPAGPANVVTIYNAWNTCSLCFSAAMLISGYPQQVQSFRYHSVIVKTSLLSIVTCSTSTPFT